MQHAPEASSVIVKTVNGHKHGSETWRMCGVRMKGIQQPYGEKRCVPQPRRPWAAIALLMVRTPRPGTASTGGAINWDP